MPATPGAARCKRRACEPGEETLPRVRAAYVSELRLRSIPFFCADPPAESVVPTGARPTLAGSCAAGGVLLAARRGATVNGVSSGHAHAHGHGDHHHHHAPSPDADARWLSLALALIAGFMVVEIAGGLLASSLALLSDA